MQLLLLPTPSEQHFLSWHSALPVRRRRRHHKIFVSLRRGRSSSSSTLFAFPSRLFPARFLLTARTRHSRRSAYRRHFYNVGSLARRSFDIDGQARLRLLLGRKTVDTHFEMALSRAGRLIRDG